MLSRKTPNVYYVCTALVCKSKRVQWFFAYLCWCFFGERQTLITFGLHFFWNRKQYSVSCFMLLLALLETPDVYTFALTVSVAIIQIAKSPMVFAYLCWCFFGDRQTSITFRLRFVWNRKEYSVLVQLELQAVAVRPLIYIK